MGDFFSKSYDNGDSFLKREEISNHNDIDNSGNGNKNPSIYEARDNTQYGRPVSLQYYLDINKNIVACWERFNLVTGRTEIKAWEELIIAHKVIHHSLGITEILQVMIYLLLSIQVLVLTLFQKFLQFLWIQFSNLGDMNTYFLIIPHLRPSSNGVKVQISARGTLNKYSEFSIDSGDVSDLSVLP